MPPKLSTAKEVSEFLLERSGSALLNGDFDTFASCFMIPTEIHTFDGQQVLESRAQLHEVFERVRDYYQLDGVTDMVRRCINSEFRDETTIVTVHETRMLIGDNQIKDPYSVLSIVHLIDGHWKIARSDYAVEDPAALVAALGKPSRETI